MFIVKITILNQWGGKNLIGDFIKTCLTCSPRRFESAKFLVYSASWGGLGLIRESLESFYANGGKLYFIVGISGGLTTIDALHYLVKQFPHASKHIFHINERDVVFHPKVYLFENAKIIAAIIGSPNLTRGGLYTNCEVGIYIEADKKEENELSEKLIALWKTYAMPSAPLEKRNLQKLDSQWLSDNSNKLAKANVAKSPIEQLSTFDTFPSLSIKHPQVPLNPFAPKIKKPKLKAIVSRETLYLEILKETGTSGTQVQIPTEVVKDFFNAPPPNHKEISLRFLDSEIRKATICHFGNNTHRVSLPEVSEVHRPAMIRFQKMLDASDLYECAIVSEKEHKNILQKGYKQTRSRSKRWREEESVEVRFGSSKT